jgi:hypothetical protein
MPSVNARDAIHALVDNLDDADLDRARKALEEIAVVKLTDEERRVLLARAAACDRGEGIDAREFLAKLRGAPSHSDG